MKQSLGYVLVTCLYVVAVLSLSTLFVMRSASLAAGHARLLEGQQALARESHRRLLLAEELEIVANDSGQACQRSSDVRIVAKLLHRRIVTGLDADGDDVDARFSIFSLEACVQGRALMESTVGVIEPGDAFKNGSVPSGVATGRLSWRRVW